MVRVAYQARFPVRDGECAEPHKGHAMPFAEARSYPVEKGFQRFGCLSLSEARLASDLLNDLAFVQENVLAKLR